jgi:hypothetical protein
MVTFKNEKSELSFQGLEPRSGLGKTPKSPRNVAFGKASYTGTAKAEGCAKYFTY